MTDLFNTMAATLRPLKVKDQLHFGVQLPQQLQTATQYTLFLEKGHKVKVDNGKIVNCDTAPTHIVEYFIGLGGGEFECHLTEIESNEKIIVKI